jgi:hypothetical protein
MALLPALLPNITSVGQRAFCDQTFLRGTPVACLQSGKLQPIVRDELFKVGDIKEAEGSIPIAAG